MQNIYIVTAGVIDKSNGQTNEGICMSATTYENTYRWIRWKITKVVTNIDMRNQILINIVPPWNGEEMLKKFIYLNTPEKSYYLRIYKLDLYGRKDMFNYWIGM